MNISRSLANGMRFVSEAVTRIFGPTDDHYPPTGVQPFEGKPAPKQKRFD